MTNGRDILTVSGLNVAYNESKVLFDVSMSVRPDQIVACVGRNGAGKTTLLKSVAGFLKPTSGSIASEGTDLVGVAPHAVARMGIKYVPQDKKVFSDLTVRENLELASYVTRDYAWNRITGYFPKLKQLMDRKAGYLSGGERQMLMIGRAILGSPKLLLVDEPTEGLAPSFVAHLKDVFRELSRTTALVIVEQNLPLVCAIAEKVYALNEGRVVAELTDRDAITPETCERHLQPTTGHARGAAA
jgi:ABC-type branched-subunit amino acid transport system ATPase component